MAMPKRGRIVVAAAVLAALAVGAIGLRRLLSYGFSARDEPTRAEIVLAQAMRRYAVPAEVRGRTNPVALTPDLLREAGAHFADHCASCHGNDGRGQPTGPRFYPRVPDMTLPSTQSQSDGELFATIENGIRLTGMPAWGDGSEKSAPSTWALVHFIRHLPQMAPAEVEAMKALNPKTRDEWQADADAETFLQGH
jgi:mono/diheme cytochrome c family protein